MELNLSNSFAALEVRKATKRKDDGNKKKRHAARQEHNLKLEQAIFGNKRVLSFVLNVSQKERNYPM